MRRTLVFLTALVISLSAAEPIVATAGVPAVGDSLSLSLTNKFGDVLKNPTVTQILGDGLVLQSGTMAMKVKYADLPPGVRQKYQPLAAGVIQKAEKQDTANAAYFAYTQQVQAEQARHLAEQQVQEDEQAKARSPDQATPTLLSIPIPNQTWKLTIANLGFITGRLEARLVDGPPPGASIELDPEPRRIRHRMRRQAPDCSEARTAAHSPLSACSRRMHRHRARAERPVQRSSPPPWLTAPSPDHRRADSR